jgi:hypothetical protein
MTSPMEGKQGSESRNLVHFCSHGWRVKNLTGRSARCSTKAGRLDAPETSKCLASFMPVGDQRSTAESHQRCGGGFAFALPSKAPLPAEQRSWCSDTTNSCARYALGAGRIRMFRSSKLVAPLQSCSVSLLPDKPRQLSTDLATDWRRSSLYRPAAQLRARTIRHGGHSYAHSQPTPIHGTFAAQRWW